MHNPVNIHVRPINKQRKRRARQRLRRRRNERQRAHQLQVEACKGGRVRYLVVTVIAMSDCKVTAEMEHKEVK